MNTLAVDIGGSSIKLLVLDEEGDPISETLARATPAPAEPSAVLALIHDMGDTLPPHQQVSVGFPGVVKDGVTWNAPNLGDALWHRVSLREQLTERLERPVRVVNDVDLQGLGVVEGDGVELVITLGTGVGAALFTRGALVPNLELGHHPYRDGQTYEDLLRDSELKQVGPAEWTARVLDALGPIERLFNYDTLHLGGGNARNLLGELPDNVRVFALAEAMRGALRLWDEA